ncbi:Glucanosyltransferase-domain-containing protein [Aspergillus pseudoustus]|uniref:1,3-beta-glucanosyltransferase n=1 Tax=Aspergillus pseudoustus TaxID=1810923 RepID=A0ABR4IM48_9EURO
MLWKLLVSSLAAATVASAETGEIVVKGSKFSHSATGEQFILKGLEYSVTSEDPLANPTACARDVPYFKSLDINTISVYTVDAAANHDECMRLLSDAGIYVIPYLNAVNGLGSGNVTWTTEDFAKQTAIVDAFVGYENVLAFFFQLGEPGPSSSGIENGTAAGNPTSTAVGNKLYSMYAKAVVRDMKAYITSKANDSDNATETSGYRQIPIGYATRVTDILDDDITFFACGDKHERVDVLGIRSDSWCSGSSFRSSGWEELTSKFEDSNVPVVMAEYYCRDSERRDEEMNDVAELYNEEMMGVWSGGLFYTYAGSDYGLVEINNDRVTKSPAFDTFASVLSSTDISPPTSSSSSPHYVDCPNVDPFYPGPPPHPDEQFCDCTLRHSLCAAVSNNVSTLAALYEDICANSNDLCRFRPTDNDWAQYGDYSMCNSSVEVAALLSEYVVELLDSDGANCAYMWGENVGPNPSYGDPGPETRTRGPQRCIHMAIGEEWDVEEADDADNEDDDYPLTRPWHGSSSAPVLFIVLVVLACLILIALIVLIVVCIRRRRRKRAVAAATATAAATSGNSPGEGAAASGAARGKQPERVDMQSDFAETAERGGDIPMASGGVGGAGEGAGASEDGRATTLMPMEFFAPGPGDERGGR